MTNTHQSPSIAEKSLDEMIKHLQGPSREERLWQSLNKQERRTLLRHAGVNTVVSGYRWHALRAYQQRDVIQAAIRMSRWAERKLVVVWEGPDDE